MRILAHLNNSYSGKATKEITYWNTLEMAKVDLYYIEYDKSYYEWITYDTGSGGFDYVAEYGRMSKAPPAGSKVHFISNNLGWNAPRCECGSEAVRAPGHSYWCPKFTP